MALSRQAKKFKDEEPVTTTTKTTTKKGAKPQAKSPAPAPKPVEPPPAPVPPPPPAEPVVVKPGKRSQKPPKRERFVYVPPKADAKPPAPKPAPLLGQRSNKLSAKLMTKNLALPPEEEAQSQPLPGTRGRT